MKGTRLVMGIVLSLFFVLFFVQNASVKKPSGIVPDESK